MQIIKGSDEFFKSVPLIMYEGVESDNPFAFRWYDEAKMVAGKSLKDHLKFSCAYWHSFNGSGADPFGEPTHIFPWDKRTHVIDRAKDKMDAAFEFITKIFPSKLRLRPFHRCLPMQIGLTSKTGSSTCLNRRFTSF